MKVSDERAPERLSNMVDTSKLTPGWYLVEYEDYSLGAGYFQYGGARYYTATDPAEWTGSEWRRWGSAWEPLKILSVAKKETPTPRFTEGR